MDLLRTLDAWDNKSVWAFDLPMFELMFDGTPGSLNTALMRHAKAGIVTRVTRGVYVNPRARSMPAEPLLALVSIMRPYEFSYLSLESVLSDAGWVSQIPFSYTLMTTGRSSVFYTPYGVVEFTHTTRAASSAEVIFDTNRGIYVATPERAYRDLHYVRRNLDMVEVPDKEAS
ncbi:MAG: type IV toxin-antitoxin system AbiEi family antitoxin [Ferrimicrobium sp.]